MSRHTPGPWQVDPRYPIDVQTADGKQEVCTPFYDGCQGNTIRPVTDVAARPEALANARLIAAAPELLEALDELANGYAGNGWDVGLVPRLKKARAAIAKAKGEEQ